MTVIEITERRETGQELTQRQRWSHYFVFIYALVALFIGFNLRSATLDATVPYVNNQVGIRAFYPQHWLIDTSGGSTYIFRVSDISALNFKTTIQVSIQPVTTNTTARNLLDTLTLNRSNSLSGYNVLSQQDDTLPNGQAATEMRYVYVSTADNPFLQSIPTVVEGMDILAIRRGQAIIISFLSDSQTFDDNLPTFQRFLDDLQF